ncbi:DUF732 domain-containing protein [Mycobacterium sp. 852014-50255_SCH5639931]|uniref:DUF732 domain-containing protein n=1 Tax=Mycobacterium sp. 852014-50255_SCH5639931 TaxID=1834112 RepID=UPI0007FFBC4A|nr:DUF732 domain-containing protein [Mycobacterium sp. 852014-50255_SCH5639931]OBB63651.1 hypothetical protein A5758_21775 [Mycobacterium sp. 852014-50255_SCH5639931]
MMMKIPAAAVLAAAMLSLGLPAPARASCSSLSDSSCTHAELTYLQILQQHGFDVSGKNAGNDIDVGKSTCADSASGGDITPAARNLWQSNNGKITMSQAVIIAQAARVWLCKGG